MPSQHFEEDPEMVAQIIEADPKPLVIESQRCVRLRVVFMGGEEREYPIHKDGDWSYREQPDRLIVRPYGKQGNARHEIPLRNILSIMVVGLSEVDGE